MKLHASLILMLVFSAFDAAWAQQVPSYSKDVRPFLARYCLECHSTSVAKGDLDLETFAGLLKGGKSGPVLVQGKPDESRFVLLPEGKAKPHMPPQKARQPKPEEVAILRAWVAAGAKMDAEAVTVRIPDIKPRTEPAPPIRALAYHPTAKVLAVGAQHDVILVDLTNDEVVKGVTQEQGEVTALAFSPDGRLLAVADSRPGTAGEVQLYQFAAQTLEVRPEKRFIGHTDVILDLAFDPQGRWLATAGYDRTVKIWDLTTGTEIRTLKDHSDAVYGVAFSPDGKLLASASADRAVKVWDVRTGARLYTLGEATDWLYAVAWSPDGTRLAAGGIDKSIRVWRVSAKSGKIAQSVFAHEGAVLRLAYGSGGQTLYSLGEDRRLKAWDAGQMVERTVYAGQPEAVLAFAVRPDRQQLALGRYDGTLALLDEKSGRVQSEPVPVKPKPPVLSKITPSAGPRGRKIRIQLEGKYLADAREVVASYSRFQARLLVDGKSSDRIQAEIEFPTDTPAGVYKLSIRTPVGTSAELPFTVDLYPEQVVSASGDSPHVAPRVRLPATVAGVLPRAGSIAFYRFDAAPGYQLGVQALTGVLGSKLKPVLQLLDPEGRVVAESSKGLLGYACSTSGTYAVGIRDRDFRGGPDMHYRLHLGDIPIVTSVFPLGLERGTEKEFHLQGVNLGGSHAIKARAPADAMIGSRLPLSVTVPAGPVLGDPAVLVGEFPEVDEPERISVPGTANGRIDKPGAIATLRFAAHRGQRLIVEVNARRIGSPLDSTIEILDAEGRPVPRAVLRSVARTFTVFRDHDSTAFGIRIENWDGFVMDDYVWVGNELIRIFALPRNPDDDCQFYSAGGQRLGYLGTTPTYLSMGQPLYKVTLHPPGTDFAPNGFPVIRLYYRNDDGGPGYGKDSMLFFDPPADGEYQVRVADAYGHGGMNYAYRLTVRPPVPSFQVSFHPTAPAVWQGSAIPVTVAAERLDGFAGPIDVHLENLPPGFSAPATTIPAGENSTAFALWVDSGTKVPAKCPPLQLVARAPIAGREVVRRVTGGMPKVMESGEISTSTEQSEVTVEPGRQVLMTARIERRGGFKGRVPLDVRGLPHGVHVLDIGLNGILVTEQDSTRTFAIYAEPWVQPTSHPFVVLARHESKGTEYAAKSVMLKVTSKN